MNFTFMVERAKKCISSKIFELSDLFERCEWDSMPKGDRIKLGKYFKNEVTDGCIPEIRYIKKSNNNHANYMKIKE